MVMCVSMIVISLGRGFWNPGARNDRSPLVERVLGEWPLNCERVELGSWESSEAVPTLFFRYFLEAFKLNQQSIA
jgi:hypothetical protein